MRHVQVYETQPGRKDIKTREKVPVDDARAA